MEELQQRIKTLEAELETEREIVRFLRHENAFETDI